MDRVEITLFLPFLYSSIRVTSLNAKKDKPPDEGFKVKGKSLKDKVIRRKDKVIRRMQNDPHPKRKGTRIQGTRIKDSSIKK